MDLIKTVIILGTGATQGSGFTKCGKSLPGDRGFFGHEFVKDRLKRYPALDIMLEFFRGRNNRKLDDISMEEVWTFLEFCSKGLYSNLHDFGKEKKELRERAKKSKPNDEEHCFYRICRKDATIPENNDWIDLSLVSGWELRTLASDVYRDCKPADKNVFKKFVEKFELKKDEEIVFINLNYDTTLEKALDLISDAKWFYPHVETKLIRNENGIKVLKPHGSLNWLFKGNKPSVSITTDYRLEPIQNVCMTVNDFEQATIIAPTQLKQELNVPETQAKPMNNLFFKIWKSMADALFEAERVFTIGYSFPSTDHHFRTLLRIVNKRKELECKEYGDVYCCTKADGREGFVFADAINFFPCQNGHHLSSEGFEAFVEENI